MQLRPRTQAGPPTSQYLMADFTPKQISLRFEIIHAKLWLASSIKPMPNLASKKSSRR